MFIFKKITIEDIPLIHTWFNLPHVQKFYSLHNWTENEVLQKLLPIIENKKPLFAYIALKANKPIGYLQYCAVKDFPWPEQDFDASIVEYGAGLDFFIGDPNLIGKGIGQKMIPDFIEQHLKPKFQYCVADPDVNNIQSIRMLEKCRFTKHKALQTSDATGKPITMQLLILRL